MVFSEQVDTGLKKAVEILKAELASDLRRGK
jgi:hypothetical protein